MPDIAGPYRHSGIERYFDEREIVGVRDRAGDRHWRDEHPLTPNKCEDFLDCIFREPELLPPQDICILIENPCIEHKDHVAIDNKVKDAGRSTPG